MGTVFPDKTEIDIIREIITRPFVPQKGGGSRFKWILGRWRKVYKVGSKFYIKHKGELLTLAKAKSLEKKPA